MLQKLQEDDSERAKNILNKIPQYIKVRMNKNEKKIVTTEGNHFIMLGLE